MQISVSHTQRGVGHDERMPMKRTTHATRLLAALMSVFLVVAVLAGCGQQQQATSANSSEAQTESQTEAGSATETQTESSSATTTDNATKADEADATQADPTPADFDQLPEGKYTLQQVVVLSRHNIRAPLSTTGSALDIATPYQWIKWSAAASELTQRGGASETIMGQYVRQWLETEGLIPSNWQPEEGQVRFYANNKMRTIATAQYFSSGMLPVANVRIETKGEYDSMNPLFKPATTYVSDAYQKAALEQIASLGDNGTIAVKAEDLQSAYKTLEEVVDYKNSEGYKSGELKDFVTDDTEIKFEVDEEPSLTGTLKTTNQLADALVLQYYEGGQGGATFGQDLTDEQWEQIGFIKSAYNKTLFSAPLVAVNCAHPLLAEIGNELDTDGRVFTFLCGHDSNIMTVLVSLQAKEAEAPGSIEAETPIGTMTVFEKWADKDGNEFGRVRLIYQSTEQLRNLPLLDVNNQPEVVDVELNGLTKNADGLYTYSDLRGRIADATDEYDKLAEKYGEAQTASTELAEAA